jgi:protein tyrosine phosphatase (PTP) superfamily phosphohydrolase (DUF442 family)
VEQVCREWQYQCCEILSAPGPAAERPPTGAVADAARPRGLREVIRMEALLNFHQATETIGTSGQPTRDQFRAIAEQGYASIVNLAMHDSDNAIADEGGIVSSLGMCYFHIPVPFDRPRVEHLRKFLRLMNALEGEKVLVHCAVNARVSAFMFKYLTLVKGWEESASVSPVLGKWWPRMDAAWMAIMDLDPGEIDL